MNAVLLPDGTVLALGGSASNEVPDAQGKNADLYLGSSIVDAPANTFVSAGAASYSRLYHSTALLLPDARVMVMGSNPGSRGDYEPAIEVYTPAYLFDANDRLITTARPSISSVAPVSGVLGYAAPFSVTYTSTSAISAAVLVPPGIHDAHPRHGPAGDRAVLADRTGQRVHRASGDPESPNPAEREHRAPWLLHVVPARQRRCALGRPVRQADSRDGPAAGRRYHVALS